MHSMASLCNVGTTAKILQGLRQLTGRDFTYEDVGITLEDESLPTFHEARIQHALTIVQIAENAGLPIATVERLDDLGEGTLADILESVTALALLSGIDFKISKFQAQMDRERTLAPPASLEGSIHTESL